MDGEVVLKPRLSRENSDRAAFGDVDITSAEVSLRTRLLSSSDLWSIFDGQCSENITTLSPNWA